MHFCGRFAPEAGFAPGQNVHKRLFLAGIFGVWEPLFFTLRGAYFHLPRGPAGRLGRIPDLAGFCQICQILGIPGFPGIPGFRGFREICQILQILRPTAALRTGVPLVLPQELSRVHEFSHL